jgi:hypothetical protein
MRRAWKRLAESAAKQSYEPADVCERASPALARDWIDEIPSALITEIRGVLRDGLQTSLFSNDTATRLAAMRSHEDAAFPMARVLLDCLTQCVAGGAAGEDALCDAATLALIDASDRRGMQIEEHYHREGSRQSAQRVRSGLKEGFGRVDYKKLAKDLLGPDPNRAARPAAKKAGLDDGVGLR